MKRKITFILLLICFVTNSQNKEYPNILRDLVGTQEYYQDHGIDFTFSGYTGYVYQGQYLKEKLIYGSATLGLGIYNSSQTVREDEKSSWWTFAGSLEVGYPLKIKIRKNKDRFIADQSYYSDKYDNSIRSTNYYTINQPEHVYVIPVAGVNYSPSPYRLQSFDSSDGSNYYVYNQAVVTMSLGVKLMRVIHNKVGIKDNKTKKVVRGSSYKYATIYAGLDFATAEFYETPSDYNNIVKADKPTLEAYIDLPSKYSNASGYFRIGVKSIPYVRTDFLRGSDGNNVNRNGFSQLYFGWRFYL